MPAESTVAVGTVVVSCSDPLGFGHRVGLVGERSGSIRPGWPQRILRAQSAGRQRRCCRSDGTERPAPGPDRQPAPGRLRWHLGGCPRSSSSRISSKFRVVMAPIKGTWCANWSSVSSASLCCSDPYCTGSRRISHIGSHRRLDPGPVALELVDHHLRNKQIQPPIEREQVQGDDQSLAVSPLIPAIRRL